jgi:4-aminobutyrate aminotransferase-like enzyme
MPKQLQWLDELAVPGTGLKVETLTQAAYAAYVHPQWLRLFLRKGMLSQICGNNFAVLKVTPRLNCSESSLDRFVAAIGQVMDAVHSSKRFWQEALAARTVKI